MVHMSEVFLYQGKKEQWEVVIGIEVHAQVSSKSKLFSGASTSFFSDPNEQVSFIDAGFPGMLPVLNECCVDQAVLTGLGLNAKINKFSSFDRKNYFYADLPQGYQISQFYNPIVTEGYVDIDLENDRVKRIGIDRLHLEQDAGKSIHDYHPKKSYIDLNRSGIALMEIVSKPDIRSAEEAMSYVKKLRTILRYLGTNDGNMDEGSLRADVNISVRLPNDSLGTRAEIKNINSIRFIGQAINYEVERQVDLIESGGCVVQETRLFDPNTGKTRTMRSKEDAQDYRYFPDPDLLPVILSNSYIEKIGEKLPELPDAKKMRFMEVYSLSAYTAATLVAEANVAAFYEKSIESLVDTKEGAKLLASWVLGDFFAALNKDGLKIEGSPISPKALASLVNLIIDQTISGRIAKEVFQEMWNSGKTPKEIVEEKGLVQITDLSFLEKIIDEILLQNQDKVKEYQNGKEKLFGFFVGQAMKKTQGKASPEIINKILKDKISQ